MIYEYEVYFNRQQLETIRDEIPEMRVAARIALHGKGDLRLWMSSDKLVKCCEKVGGTLRHYHTPVAQKLREMLGISLGGGK